jgi:hypothetical protein
MRRRGFAVLAVLVTGLLFHSPSSLAVTGGQVTGFTAGCDSFVVTYEAVTFDRDNTGANQEAYTGRITDADGTVLLTFAFPAPVGTVITGQTEVFAYTTPPVRNPIRFVLVSDAGNGLPQQAIWDLSGSCNLIAGAQVPALSPLGLAALALGLAGAALAAMKRGA